MASFYDQIKNLTDSAPKPTTASRSELTLMYQKADRYAQNIVAEVKADILQKAQSGKLSHVTTYRTHPITFDKTPKHSHPHYQSGTTINYVVDVYKTGLDFKMVEYVEDNSPMTRPMYYISDYAVLEYMVKRIIELLAQEKIYAACPDPRYRDNAASILERAKAKQVFKEAKATGKSWRHSVAISCVLFV